MKGNVIIDITTGDNHNNFVPNFFQSDWKKRTGENPLENEKCYDRLARRGAIVIVLAIICIFVSVGLMIWVTAERKNLSPLIISFVIMSVGLLLLGGFMVPNNNQTRWHFHAYYERLIALFNLFKIVPNVRTGFLNKTEFRKSVEESLMAFGKFVDGKVGFDRETAREQFKAKHAEALFWELCDESWDKYFPKKVK